MRRLIAAVVARLRLRPRPSGETAASPTVRAPRQAGPARTTAPTSSAPTTGTATTGPAIGRSTKGAATTGPVGTSTATARRAPSPGPARDTQARPPAQRERARVVATPPTRGRRLVYAPELDGRADPGEIVWAWVPYEEDPTRGKDRPVLVVGRDGATLLGLMLSSNAERDGQPHWYALGTGAWDRQQRPSWVRLDRVLLVDEDGIRREGDILARPRFEAIARVLRANYGWQ